jgi:hypothetical protein
MLLSWQQKNKKKKRRNSLSFPAMEEEGDDDNPNPNWELMFASAEDPVANRKRKEILHNLIDSSQKENQEEVGAHSESDICKYFYFFFNFF